MSLVGPRVIQFSEIPAFGELIELRQTVKPGLTGLWQVSGRSMTNYEQRCILDCTYVLEHSFWIDIRILVKTLPVVIRRVGAY
jgi:lipopolysaccharide/colanic/teichoic acid biosynthesis glycosyltransferase